MARLIVPPEVHLVVICADHDPQVSTQPGPWPGVCWSHSGA